jgi:hypothetical protein
VADELFLKITFAGRRFQSVVTLFDSLQNRVKIGSQILCYTGKLASLAESRWKWLGGVLELFNGLD